MVWRKENPVREYSTHDAPQFSSNLPLLHAVSRERIVDHDGLGALRSD